MQKLEVLLFDVDGTLADTERDGHRVAFNQAFASEGLDWDWSVETYGQLLTVTGGKERIKYYLSHFLPEFQAPTELDSFVAKLHAAKTEYYKALMVDPGLPLRPGVERLLQEARARELRMAIVTTTTPANVSALLTNSLAVDAEGWFEVIAAGDVVPAKKPAPDIYDWAMTQMGVSPEQCLAFEDSDNGLKSVQGAGIRSIVVTVNGYTAAQDFTGASIVLDNLGSPGAPARVLSGDTLADGMITVNNLEKIHADAWRQT